MKYYVLLILTALLLFAAAASAELPTDPWFSDAQNRTLDPALDGLAPAAKDSGADTDTITFTLELITSQPLGYNEPAEWQVHASGGNGEYTYSYHLCSSPRSGSAWVSNGYVRSTESDTFSYTFLVPDKYTMWVSVRDSEGHAAVNAQGSTWVWCGAYYTVAEDEDHPPLTTVIADLAAECEAQGFTDDYSKILWFHDYMLRVSTYDSSLTYHSADGVLLRGTGVCDSYSKAMDLLSNAVGIPCSRVTGGNHAWNILYMDGSWSMVDATWDDSGIESRLYFGLTTEMIAQDHTITKYENYRAECTSLQSNYALRSGMVRQWMDSAFSDGYSVSAQLEDMAASGEMELTLVLPSAVRLYEGLSMYSSYRLWLVWPVVAQAIRDNGLELAGLHLSLDAEWSLGDTEMPVRVTALPEIKEWVTLPAGVTSVDEETFAQNRQLRGVSLPEGVTAIGDNAFAGCMRLQEIIVPTSVTEIAEDAFDNCFPYLLIRTPAGSYAEGWATLRGYRVEAETPEDEE